MLTNKNKLKKQKDVTTKCTSMRSGVLFSGVVDESVCAIKTFFFFFLTIHLAHMKLKSQLFEASEMTPHFSRQSHSQKTAP